MIDDENITIKKFKELRSVPAKNKRKPHEDFTDEEMITIYKWGKFKEIENALKNKNIEDILSTFFSLSLEETDRGTFRKLIRNQILLKDAQKELFTFFCSQYQK